MRKLSFGDRRGISVRALRRLPVVPGTRRNKITTEPPRQPQQTLAPLVLQMLFVTVLIRGARLLIVRGSLTIDGLRVPAEIDQLEAFRAWVRTLEEDAPRVHFSHGRVWIQMSPQDYFSHVRLVGQLNARLELLAQELDLGEYWSDGGWLTNELVGLSTEPDGFLVCWQTMERGEARFAERRGGRGPIELLGRGDMVLEVVSDYSVDKDTVQLMADYASAGFSEYWLVDARVTPVSFRLLVLQADGAYREATCDDDGFVASPIWNRRFRVDAQTNRAGHPTYRLLVR